MFYPLKKWQRKTRLSNITIITPMYLPFIHDADQVMFSHAHSMQR